MSHQYHAERTQGTPWSRCSCGWRSPHCDTEPQARRWWTEHAYDEASTILYGTGRECVVNVYRMGSTLTFGPFESPDDAATWCERRRIRGTIVGIHSADIDTGAFAEVWL